MQFWKSLSLNRQAVLLAALMTASLHIYPVAILAQNPSSAPVFDKAVQGQQATQPEGTVLNIVNWIRNGFRRC